MSSPIQRYVVFIYNPVSGEVTTPSFPTREAAESFHNMVRAASGDSLFISEEFPVLASVMLKNMPFLDDVGSLT